MAGKSGIDVSDLIMIAAVGGVGLYVVKKLGKGTSGGGGGTVVVPPLPPIPPAKDDGEKAPQIIVMPQLPNPNGGGTLPPVLNITMPDGTTKPYPLTPDPPTDPVETPTTPEDPEEPPKDPPTDPPKPPPLPPPVDVPEWNTDVGTWTARTLNLSGANGGVLQHAEKWHTEFDKRREDTKESRPGKLWDAYYAATSSPGAVWLGNALGFGD